MPYNRYFHALDKVPWREQTASKSCVWTVLEVKVLEPKGMSYACLL